MIDWSKLPKNFYESCLVTDVADNPFYTAANALELLNGLRNTVSR
jgi:hypothetical protein